MDRGSLVHERIHRLLLDLQQQSSSGIGRSDSGDRERLEELEQEGDDEIRGFLASFAAVLPRLGAVRLLETSLVHADLGYAGTVDCVAEWVQIVSRSSCWWMRSFS